MRSRVLSGVVAALVVVGLSACSSNKSDTADRVDQALKQANVKNVDVHWDKEANVVHLEGTVDTPDQRSKAEQVATDVVGTSGKVMNELTVEGMDDTTADNADGVVKSRIDDAVRADPQLTNRTIDVNVTDALVTLTGEVNTVAEKEKAGQIAKATAGVKDVANEIHVGKQATNSGKGLSRR